MFSGPWFNETKVDYSRFRRNPSPNDPGWPRASTISAGGNAIIGSNRSTQDFIQKRLGLRNDLTYSGFQMAGEHVIKAGASIDFVKYDVFKDNDGTPSFIYSNVQDGVNYGFRSPFELATAPATRTLKTNNNQVGLYIQDDWSPTLAPDAQPRRSLGLRVEHAQLRLRHAAERRRHADPLQQPAHHAARPRPLHHRRHAAQAVLRCDPAASGRLVRARQGAARPRSSAATASTTTASLFDLFAVDETQKISHPTYTVRFAPEGVRHRAPDRWRGTTPTSPPTRPRSTRSRASSDAPRRG